MQTDISITEISLLDRIYKARNITNQQEIDYSFKNLLMPDELHQITLCSKLLLDAYAQQQKIIIVGDFDTDGATSTAVALKCLRMFGYKNIDYIIPDRFKQGYGLSIDVAKQVIKKQADLVITVDNGISCLEGIEFLRQHNISVIITDHHLPSSQLPNANAIINPNQDECNFPSKNLAGVGVIFYVMWHLRNSLKQQYKTQEFASLISVLDLVALGTVADVVPLDTNNRIIVKTGMQIINHGNACIGMQALIKIAKKNHSKLNAADLGFVLAPRLNAAGRLENMSIGVELLLSNDENHAIMLAQELNSLNDARKNIELDMREDALNICNKFNADNIPLGIVLYDESWHQGIIGIVSARLKEKYYRPVITFAPDKDNIIKGSARSISGLHIKDVLNELDLMRPNLMLSFGGHAMAAGLSIKHQDLDEFTHLLHKILANKLTNDLLENIVYTDGELSVDDFSFATVEMLNQKGPWGQNFPEPLFDGKFQIIQHRIIGSFHLKLVVQPIIDGKLSNSYIDAILFNFNQHHLDLMQSQVTLIYSLEINEFNYQKNLQLLVREMM